MFCCYSYTCHISIYISSSHCLLGIGSHLLTWGKPLVLQNQSSTCHGCNICKATSARLHLSHAHDGSPLTVGFYHGEGGGGVMIGSSTIVLPTLPLDKIMARRFKTSFFTCIHTTMSHEHVQWDSCCYSYTCHISIYISSSHCLLGIGSHLLTWGKPLVLQNQSSTCHGCNICKATSARLHLSHAHDGSPHLTWACI